MPPAAVLVDDLVIRRGGRTIVDRVTFQAPQGSVTAIVGPNGAGKTSTIEACVGLLTPSAGSIHLLGSDKPDPSAVTAMLQDGGLYPTARPLELVHYVSTLYPDPLDPSDLLGRVGLDPMMKTTVRRMSGGEQQRLKVALALVGRPRLTFLDEPTAGLDATGRAILYDLVRELVGAGASVVITTHLMEDVESLADHLVVMNSGKVLAEEELAFFIGSDSDVWFTAPPGSATHALGHSVTEAAPGIYIAHDASDAAGVAEIASWCADQSGPSGIAHIGRRPLADAVATVISKASAGAT